MAELGRADLLIVPKFDNLSATMDKALGQASKATEDQGKKHGSGFSKGFSGGLKGMLGSGAVIGAFSAITSKAMDVIGAHVGSAVSRIDTLKNYPKVMEALGVASNVAQSSIDTMSDRLSNLPTRLDTMASTVQGLYAAMKDYGVSLGTVTNAGLALNDMLLAGGQGQQVVNAAMEQFRQMLTKGKPDMQDWKSIISAAPGQMDQLAKSMLGPTANANDLYEALGGGNHGQTISMQKLLDEIIRLDSEGGAGLASFQQQAENATNGIQTAADNMGNAFTKGIAKVIDAVGTDTIVGGLNLIKDATNTTFNVIAGGTENIINGIKYFDDGKLASKRLSDAMQEMSGSAKAAAGNFDTLGNTAERAMKRASQSQEKATKAHQEYLDQLSKSADVVDEANNKYQTQTASLEYAGQVIDTYAGKTGLSAAQQDELKTAIDTVNQACGTEYGVIEGSSDVIDKNTGKVQENTTEIWNNIHAREAAAKAEALLTAKLEADKAQAKAANEFQAQKQAAADSAVALQALIEKYGSLKAVREKAKEATTRGKVSAEAIEVRNTLNAYTDYANGLKKADAEQRQLAQTSKELAAEQAALSAKASGAELSVSQLALAADVAQQAFNDGGSKAKYSIVDFSGALESAAKNDDALRKAMGDPDTLAEIVAAYDGSAGSLKDVLNKLGVGFDDAAAKAADANGTISQMGDWIANLGGDVYSSMALMGVGTDELASKLSGAGVSMEDLKDMGADTFSELASSANGSIDQMLASIANYNDTELDPKESSINVNDLQLMDAQGKVYTWNNNQLEDKNGHVAVNDAQLTDAAGNVWKWNGTKLEPKSSTVTVTGNMADGKGEKGVDKANKTVAKMKSKSTTAKVNGNAVNGSAASAIKRTTNMISNLHSKTVTVTTNIVETKSSGGGKKGGRGRAHGGIRKHAVGAIFRSPTWISDNDIIGENGDEYYDGKHIVPLSNKQYSRPFANLIAEETTEQLKALNKARSGAVLDSAAVGSQIAQSLNGAKVILDTGEVIGSLALNLSRRAAMNIG